VTERKRGLYDDLIKEIRAVVSAHQANPAWKDDPRGFDFYPRAMFTQTGSSDRTDYFTHIDRVKCEKAVLRRLKGPAGSYAD
jgi:hypothetical protein